VIDRRRHTRFPGAVGTAEKRPVCFDPVPDDFAIAMRTGGRQAMNGALKTVKGVSLSGDDYLERPLVVIAAYFASSHGNLLEGEQREKVQNVRQRRW
jgi:hypothetical protein